MESQSGSEPSGIVNSFRHICGEIFKITIFCAVIYTFVMIMFFFIGLVYTITSVNGEIPTLSFSLERPFHTDLQNVYLDSKKISWSVADLPDQNYISAFAKSKIGDELNDQTGWRDAGREFIYIEPGSSSPDILFLPTTSAETEKLCRQTTNACAYYTGYSYLSLPPIKIGVPYSNTHSIVASCYVPFIQGFMDGSSLAHIVNHEVGHCMGLGHSSNPDDVMHNSNYPSPSEIRLIREMMTK